MKDKYDVIIVGAGPAGSMAAYEIAKEGLDVLLLEKDRSVGIPVLCAEGITTEGMERFFNIKDIPKQWVSATIEGAIAYSPQGRKMVVHHPEAGYVLERKIFDRDIAMRAVDMGAHLFTSAMATGLEYDNDVLKGVFVEYKGERKFIQTNIVIGADGVESLVGRWASISDPLRLQDVDSCVQITMRGIDVQEGYAEFGMGNDIAPGGYFWIFPKGKNWANVGIGVNPAIAQEKAIYYMNKFIEKRFKRYSVVEYITGAVPVKPLKNISGNGVLLCGDAARLADPLSGGGIANAMWSGSFAGKVAAQAVKEDNYTDKFLSKYDDMWNKAYGKEMKLRETVKNIYLKMNDKRLEELYEIINDIVGGKTVSSLDSTEMVFKVLKHSPKVLKWGVEDLLKMINM